ncbi:GNAT family N-acetyltransferase [uncultured Cellulomonas sp.]|uniref:GNAT family N-acetyltransferase n=1 Tax=uncultured Cellulomonas sp. TaxID=189682 RepID=UPI002613FA89|nr:GNAT family N-acetyltransferase [uncultured Cellulomonas sp.]
MVTLETVPWDDADATRLRTAMQAEMRDLYQDDDEPVPLRDTSTIAAMVLLRVDGDPAACAALRHVRPGSWGAGEPGPGLGEVKRVYVAPRFRGRGLSRRVLAEVERLAAGAGLHRVVLETGDRQTAAMALYEASGYVRTERYGGYADVEQSRCYAKDLVAP